MSFYRYKYTIRLILGLFIFLSNGESLKSQLTVGIKASYFLSMSQAQELSYDDTQDFLSHKIRFIEEDVSPVPELFASLSNERTYVKLGLAYRRIQTRFSFRDFLDYANTHYSPELKRSSTLLLPMEAGLKLKNMRFGAGPSLSFLVSENTVFESIRELEERRNMFTTGYHISFSITHNRLMFEILFEERFHGVAEYIYYRGDSQSFDQRAKYISLGLAYTLDFN